MKSDREFLVGEVRAMLFEIESLRTQIFDYQPDWTTLGSGLGELDFTQLETLKRSLIIHLAEARETARRQGVKP